MHAVFLYKYIFLCILFADIQRPVVSHCPRDIILNATERTLQVNWTEPDISDPFGNTVQVTKNYAHPTFTFPWGDFTVQYHGTKISNGLSAECTFQINIRRKFFARFLSFLSATF